MGGARRRVIQRYGLFYEASLLRRMTTQRASNRGGVHGSKLPTGDVVNHNEVDEEIQKGKEEREKIRNEVEEKVDKELDDSTKKDKGSQVLSDSDTG